MAFLAPALLLLIFLTIQGALFFYGRNVALQSAREAVTQLRLAQDQATYDNMHGGVIKNVEHYAHTVGGGSLIAPVVSSRYDDAQNQVTATVSGKVISLVPGLDLTVTEHAYGAIERFEVDQ